MVRSATVAFNRESSKDNGSLTRETAGLKKNHGRLEYKMINLKSTNFFLAFLKKVFKFNFLKYVNQQISYNNHYLNQGEEQ